MGVRPAFYLSLALAALIVFLSACSKQNENDSSSNPSLTELLKQNDWNVALFMNADANHTTQFNGYHFHFNSDSTISVTHDLETETGDWEIGKINNSPSIAITFPGSSQFLSSLSGNWQLSVKVYDHIEFQEKDEANSNIRLLRLVIE